MRRRKGKKMKAATLAAVLLGAGLIFVPAAEGDSTTRLAIGDLGSPRDGMPAIDQALTLELQRSGARVTTSSRAEFILTGAVTRFEVDRSAHRVSLECEVSLVVSDREGNVRFLLNGRAAGRGAPRSQLRASVLRAAVRGAIRNLSVGIENG
jgi:hypothetical protein